MKQNCLKYFDLTTQYCFDIFSHMKFLEAFNGAVVGSAKESILVQYVGDTGCPSPGIRFFMKTSPNCVYHLRMEGQLAIGNEACLYIETEFPKLRIVPENNRFFLGKNNIIDLNFRAKGEYTSIGILFDSARCDACLIIRELLVSRIEDCGLKKCNGCPQKDKHCIAATEYPTIPICSPPKVEEICPPPLPLGYCCPKNKKSVGFIETDDDDSM